MSQQRQQPSVTKRLKAAYRTGKLVRAAPATAGAVALCVGLTLVWLPLGIIAAGLILLAIDYLVVP